MRLILALGFIGLFRRRWSASGFEQLVLFGFGHGLARGAIVRIDSRFLLLFPDERPAYGALDNLSRVRHRFLELLPHLFSDCVFL